MTHLALWAGSFALTLGVELPLLLLLVRDVPRPRALLAGVAATGIAHPLLWFAWQPRFSDWDVGVITGELAVVALESVVLKRGLPTGWPRAVGLAALLNGASFLVGSLVRAA